MEYTIQSGDSLYQLATKFGIPLAELIAANPQLQNPDLVYPGQIIAIPQGTTPKTRDKYRLPDPYPEIRVVGKNPFYAQLLLDDYAGKVSETTAIMQYVHHHMEMEATPGWQEMADLLEGVSIVEMEHMEMLGETIILLGECPRYCDSQQQPWTPLYVEYCDFDPCSQLRADIKGEQDAIHQYRAHIQMIQDPNIQALITRIIKDEEHHIQLFTEQLSRLCKS